MDGNFINYSAFGKRIWIRRNELKMSQATLAKRIDVSVSYIGHLERGEKKPSVETVARLCTVLRITADYLLFGRKVLCDREKCSLIRALDELIHEYRK